MYRVKCSRGRTAVRSAVAAFSLACLTGSACSLGVETSWINPASTGIWGTATNWSAGVPGLGDVADIFTAVNVSYNVSGGSPDLSAVQLAGGTASTPSELTLSNANGAPFLQTHAIVLGGTFTGPTTSGGLGYGAASSGPGEIVHSAGTVLIDFAGVVNVDPASIYILSGSGLLSAYNEVLVGTFAQSGSSYNNLSGGSVLTNAGSYTISGGVTRADTVNNTTYTASSNLSYTGSFTQSGTGSLQGSSGSTFSFNNNGSYFYSGTGSFNGTMNNNVGATINITSAAIPFGPGLVNNGRTTVTGGTGTYAGIISGSGTLIFSGATAVTLTGSSTFTGPTTLTSGTLILNGPVPMSSPGNNSGGSINGSLSIGSSATLQTNADLQIASTSALTINGGILNLNTHDQSVSSLTMTAGQVAQPSGVGLGIATGLVTINKGSATINGGLRSNLPLKLTVASNGNLVVNGSMSAYNSAAGTLLLTGGGILSISASSILSSIDVQQGILQVAQGGSFASSNPLVTVENAGSFVIGNQSVSVGDVVGPGTIGLGTGALTVNSSGGTFAGSITGTGTFNKAGVGSLTLTGTDSSSGNTNVTQGTFTVDSTGSIGGNINVSTGASAVLRGTLNNLPTVTANGTVNFAANPGSGLLVRNISALNIGPNTVAGNGQVNLQFATPHTNRTLLVATGVTMSGALNAWTSQLDLSNNDLDVHNGSLTALTNQAKTGFAGGRWNGPGLASSAAASDNSHLTALGVSLNDDGAGMPLYSNSPTSLGLFDGIFPSITDVLAKYTYYGDANLDGHVDGSDYSRIDNSFAIQTPASPATGWYNGDFNYDGVVNGSDYTLIDNAYNTQGDNLTTSAEMAHVTSELAGPSSVPEPAFAVAAIAFGLVTLGRRRACRSNIEA